MTAVTGRVHISRQRLLADGLLIAAAAIWGVGFLFQKQAMDHVDPLTFLAARSGLAALALAPFALLERRRRPKPRPRGLLPSAVLARTIFLSAGWLQQSGLDSASVTNTGFLTSLYVVFTPIVAWLALGRRPSPIIYLAVALSFAGTWLMSGGSLGKLAAGDALVICAAAGWAMHVVVLSAASRFERPLTFTFVQFAFVALISAGLALACEQPAVAQIRAAGWDIAYVGLLSSALTFSIFTYAVRHTPASEAAVLVSTECLFAAVAGALALGERLPPVSWAGAALILAAILAVQVPPRGAARPSAS